MNTLTKLDTENLSSTRKGKRQGVLLVHRFVEHRGRGGLESKSRRLWPQSSGSCSAAMLLLVAQPQRACPSNCTPRVNNTSHCTTSACSGQWSQVGAGSVTDPSNLVSPKFQLSRSPHRDLVMAWFIGMLRKWVKQQTGNVQAIIGLKVDRATLSSIG